MKRSEMIRRLEHRLYGTTNNPYCQEKVKDILDKIEEMGMAPPYHPTKGYEAVEENPTGTKTYYRKKIREWEDETK